MPGNSAVDIWETANNAAVLGALGYARDPRVEQAGAWISARAGADGSFPVFQHATYAMGAYHWLRGELAQAETYMCESGRFLQQYGREPWFDTMDLVWALMLWQVGRIPTEHPVVRSHLEALEARRMPDGTWPTRYSGCEAQYTMEALAIRKVYR